MAFENPFPQQLVDATTQVAGSQRQPDALDADHRLSSRTSAASATAALHAMLEQTRAQGYALRSKDVRPVSNTLAVPVFESGHVMASIGLTWFSSALDTDAAVFSYLQRMQEAARDIELQLNAMGVGAPPAASRTNLQPTRRTNRNGQRKRVVRSPGDAENK